MSIIYKLFYCYYFKGVIRLANEYNQGITEEKETIFKV